MNVSSLAPSKIQSVCYLLSCPFNANSLIWRFMQALLASNRLHIVFHKFSTLKSCDEGFLEINMWNLSESLGANGVMSILQILLASMNSLKVYLALSITFLLQVFLELSTNFGILAAMKFIRADYLRLITLCIILNRSVRLSVIASSNLYVTFIPILSSDQSEIVSKQSPWTKSSPPGIPYLNTISSMLPGEIPAEAPIVVCGNIAYWFSFDSKNIRD